jgi:hypothetical protein
MEPKKNTEVNPEDSDAQIPSVASCYIGSTFPRCEIVPITKRLKQVVKEYGVEWFVISPLRKMQCFDNTLGVKVRSYCGEHTRNVRYPSQILFY